MKNKLRDRFPSITTKSIKSIKEYHNILSNYGLKVSYTPETAQEINEHDPVISIVGSKNLLHFVIGLDVFTLDAYLEINKGFGVGPNGIQNLEDIDPVTISILKEKLEFYKKDYTGGNGERI